MTDFIAARRKAKKAAKRYLDARPHLATISEAVDRAISVYNIEIGFDEFTPPAGTILPAGQTQSVADYPELVEALRDKPTPVEALAERLAKVEDRLANTRSAHIATLDQRVVDERLQALDDRITKVAEIIGERVSGLVDEIAAVRDSSKRAHERVEDIRDHVGLNGTADGWTLGDKVLRLVDFASALGFRMGSNPTPPPAFPTGGAGTAEAATDAVLPVPQRGDRVRLEGATSHGGFLIDNGWYNVTGQNGDCFQIKAEDSSDPDYAPSRWLSYVDNTCPGLKEVRHADQH